MTLLSLKDYRDGNIPKKPRNSTTEDIANNLKEILDIEISLEEPKETSPSIIPSEPVNESAKRLSKLNEANESEILEVKGIGPKTVQKILAKRPFLNWEEVKQNLPESVYRGLYNKFSIC